tara:strand:+ start:1744 stop:3474 length:1731 start_codon:yes stop_codon:yes gene_type:complete
MKALDKAIQRMESVKNAQFDEKRNRTGAYAQMGDSTPGYWRDKRQQTNLTSRYHLFQGWLYSAIHALSSRAANAPCVLGKKEYATDAMGDDPKRTIPGSKWHSRPEGHQKYHGDNQGVVVLEDSHLAYDVTQNPNPFQSKWDFLYMMTSNLNLTGWAFVVVDYPDQGRKGRKRPHFYALPSSWIIPDHTNGPFSLFRLINPNDPNAKPVDLSPENVGMARFPNPGNPLAATSPVAAQLRAIKIDQNIQTSQEMFFENGIFPSVIVSMGKQPHPDAMSDGVRPRLSASQRRQVTNAIRKVMTGVHNYGNPAIIDGMIDSIQRLSATQNEMGWEKSEDKVRTRILSSLGVHPFMLGELSNVGGYAQATVIRQQFCDRVNILLGMTSLLVEKLVQTHIDPKLMFWYEKCEAEDLQLQAQNMREARTNGDISKNEYRAFLNLPPVEETQKDPSLSSTQGVQNLMNILSMNGAGNIDHEQARTLLEILFSMSKSEVERLIPEPEEVPEALQGIDPALPVEDEVVAEDDDEESDSDADAVDEEDEEEKALMMELRNAVAALRAPLDILENHKDGSKSDKEDN